MTVARILTQPHAAGEIELYRVTNASGAYVDLCNVGAGVAAVVVPDREGRMVPIADNVLYFTLKGPGTLLATCSADLTDCTAYTLPQRKAWKGRVLAVVKSGKETGELTLTVKSKGLKTEKIKITVHD